MWNTRAYSRKMDISDHFDKEQDYSSFSAHKQINYSI